MRLVDYLRQIREKLEHIYETCMRDVESCIFEYFTLALELPALEKLKNSAWSMYAAEKRREDKYLYELFNSLYTGHLPSRYARDISSKASAEALAETIREIVEDVKELEKYYENEDLHIYSGCIVRGRPGPEKLSMIGATCDTYGGYYSNNRLVAANNDIALELDTENPREARCFSLHPEYKMCERLLVSSISDCYSRNGEVYCTSPPYHNLGYIYRALDKVEEFRTLLSSLVHTTLYGIYSRGFVEKLAMADAYTRKEFETPLVVNMRREIDNAASRVFGEKRE
ncbi:MAG: hypothetical protein GXO26_08260 [Crenarchaeota archaeon]|nr:hypothetical protein [Thermoproteota archaeon]